MKKLKVTNRTQIVCRAYGPATVRPLSLATGPSPEATVSDRPILLGATDIENRGSIAFQRFAAARNSSSEIS
jgi:hypothetical protein